MGAIGESAAVDVRPQIAKVACHFLRNDIPELELPDAGRIDDIARAAG